MASVRSENKECQHSPARGRQELDGQRSAQSASLIGWWEIWKLAVQIESLHPFPRPFADGGCCGPQQEIPDELRLKQAGRQSCQCDDVSIVRSEEHGGKLVEVSLGTVLGGEPPETGKRGIGILQAVHLPQINRVRVELGDAEQHAHLIAWVPNSAPPQEAPVLPLHLLHHFCSA